MTDSKSQSQRYVDHLFSARDLLRGEVADADATKLLLSVYGLKVLADPLTPNDRVQEAARAAWEKLVNTHQSASPQDALESAVLDVSPHLLSNEEGTDQPQAGSTLALAGLIPDLRESERVIPRLVRHAQLLWPFEGTQERRSFVNALEEVALTSTSKHRGVNEMVSSLALNELLGIVMSKWVAAPQSTVYDPTMGAGGTLIEVAQALSHDAVRLPDVYGQELNFNTLFIAAWRLAINDFHPLRLRQGDVLLNPGFLDANGRLKQFDVVVSVPPLSMGIPSRSARSQIEIDPHNRFQYGLPRSNSADWLFAQHALASTKTGGVAAVIVSPGALFRSGPEAEIRRKVIMADHVSAVFLLPSSLIPGTSIQSALVVLEPRKPIERQETTRLIDLSNVEQAELAEATRRALTEDDPPPNISLTVTLEDLRGKDYNLLPTPYLPPRNVRVNLASREQAERDFQSAMADLEQEMRSFNEAMKAFEAPSGR